MLIEVVFVASKVENDGRVEVIPIRPQAGVQFYLNRVNSSPSIGRTSSVNTRFAYIPEGLQVDVGDVCIAAINPHIAIIIAKLKKYSRAILYTTQFEAFVRQLQNAQQVKLQSRETFINSLLDKLVVKSNSVMLYYTFSERTETSHEGTRPQVDFIAMKYKNKIWTVTLGENNNYFYTYYKLDNNYLKYLLSTRDTKVAVYLNNQGERIEVKMGNFSIIYQDSKLFVEEQGKNAGIIITNNNIILQGNVHIKGDVNIENNLKTKIYGSLEVSSIKTQNAEIGNANIAKINNFSTTPLNGGSNALAIFDLATGGLPIPMIAPPTVVSPMGTPPTTPSLADPITDNENQSQIFDI